LRKYNRLKLTVTISFKPTTGPVVATKTTTTAKAPTSHRKKHR
jgi:hypothetical protein